ncbi:MAG TPA: carotenoid biosynthesis protein [Blastocatellia bacterium]|nr:carotenoid biosynthesis protein [Blastocatellia bacterium]
MQKAFYILVTAYLLMWAGGIGSHLLNGKPPTEAAWASALFLLLAGLIVFFSTDRRDWWKLMVTGLVGLAAEAVGVQFGFLFSPYRYTEVLQPQLLGVPLVMACAWFVLIAYIRQMVQGAGLPRWLEVTLSAAWMTAIDLVIDPLAAGQLGYWRWQQSGVYYGIPAHNFAGWFIVSLIIFAIVRKDWQPNQAAKYVGLSIVIFFTAISFAHGLVLTGGIGLGLCAVHFLPVLLTDERHSQRLESCKILS